MLLDDRDRVQLVNDEARRLLRLPDDVVGRSIHDLGLPPGLVGAAVGDTAESDDIYLTEDHVLVVSSSPASWAGREVGAVVTLRDHTDLQAVTGELDVVRGLTESLRSQNHEAANRLHTVVSLIEMGRTEEAVDFATEELQVAQLLTDRVVGAVDDPVLAALLLGKTAEAAERGIELTVVGEVTGETPDVEPRDLVTVVGQPRRQRDGRGQSADRTGGSRSASTPVGDRFAITVGDSGPGLPPDAGATGARARVVDQGLDDEARRVAGSAWPWSRRWPAATAAPCSWGPRRTAAPSSPSPSAPAPGATP